MSVTQHHRIERLQPKKIICNRNYWHLVQTINQTLDLKQLHYYFSRYPCVNIGLRIVLKNTPRCLYTNETSQKSKIYLRRSVPPSHETHNYISSDLRKSQKILRCSALGVETELEEHLVRILCLCRNPLYTDSLK